MPAQPTKLTRLTVTDADGLNVGGKVVSQQFTKEFELPGTQPATAANFGVIFFVADAPCQLTASLERHATAGNDAGAVTVMLKKVPSGTASGSGTDMLSAGISAKAVADTNQAGALHATAANLQLAAGDGVAVVLTGTPTALAGFFMSATFKRI